jgi:hypothetical protein
MNNNFVAMWKEAFVTRLDVCSRHLPGGTEENTIILRKAGVCNEV